MALRSTTPHRLVLCRQVSTGLYGVLIPFVLHPRVHGVVTMATLRRSFSEAYAPTKQSLSSPGCSEEWLNVGATSWGQPDKLAPADRDRGFRAALGGPGTRPFTTGEIASGSWLTHAERDARTRRVRSLALWRVAARFAGLPLLRLTPLPTVVGLRVAALEAMLR